MQKARAARVRNLNKLNTSSGTKRLNSPSDAQLLVWDKVINLGMGLPGFILRFKFLDVHFFITLANGDEFLQPETWRFLATNLVDAGDHVARDELVDDSTSFLGFCKKIRMKFIACNVEHNVACKLRASFSCFPQLKSSEKHHSTANTRFYSLSMVRSNPTR